MLRKLLLSTWYILVSALILLAIVISIIRSYPTIYQSYLPAIQQNISSMLGKPIHADSIRIDWHGITPQITTSNLSIYEDENQYEQLLNVDKAIITLDVYRSLLQKSIAFKELTFIGGNLELLRTADEKIIVNGIDISERLAERKKLNQRNELNINLLNSTISIIDEIKKLDYFFDHIDIVLGFSGEHFKLNSNFTLPKTLGESLTLSADIRDLDKGFKNIKGKFYSKGKNINLELVHDIFPTLQAGMRKGVSDFQLWGNFNSLRQRKIIGEISLRDLVYDDIEVPVTSIAVNEEITAISSKFGLKGDIENWQLSLHDVNVTTAGNAWTGEQYEVSCVGCGKQEFTLAASLDHISTDQLLATLQHFPFISKSLNDVFAKIEIRGVLETTQLLAQFSNHQLIKYSYKSSLQDADISIPEQKFALRSIAGGVEGDHLQGYVDLNSNAMGVQLDKILDQVLDKQNIKGVLNWQFFGDNILVGLERLSVESNEMVANLQGTIHIFETNPFIDIQIEIPFVEVETIKQYLPYKKMHPKLSKWLSESITTGVIKNGKLLFHGNPKYFPFKNKPGKFEILAKVEEGVLDYRQDWPSVHNIVADLSIENNYLEFNASQGTILDSSITRVRASIDDLKLPKLEINGSAVGPASNILSYLQQSSLLPKDSKIVKNITPSGNTKLDLNIVLTLTAKLKKQIDVSGVIDFQDAGLIVNALPLPFTNINGKLNFDQTGADSNGLSAKLYGFPIRAQAKKSAAGRTLLSVSGDLNLDAYLSLNYPNINTYVKGAAPTEVQINIPSFDKNNTDKDFIINANSDLYGATILLPEPFKKSFDESKKISIQTKFQQETNSQIYSSLNNQVFMQAIIDNVTGKLSSMELRIGDDKFSPVSDGIKISGSANTLALAEWREFMQSKERQTTDVKEIDLFVNQVTVGGLKLDEVNFSAIKDTQFWRGSIKSSIAQGRFEYPVDTKSGSIATASLDYLRFEENENDTKASKLTASNASNLDPRTLPALVVNAKQFEYKGAVFDDVSLKTKPLINGLAIDSLQGNGKNLQVSANGTWIVDEKNDQITNFKISLTTQNLQNTLEGLDFNSAVEGGHGNVSADFSWPKAPYQFSLASVTGNAVLNIKDGTISSVEPGGAGRLVGLFNLGEISRRLSLDFTDFFGKGYSFEKITGDLKFSNANLITQNLEIKGPSADLLIQGRTGLEVQDYDQVVTVTPHVSGGLPWIGLAVGGPLGAVGVMVGERIAKSIGVDINKVSEVKYKVQGSWENPVIEPIAQKVVEKKYTPKAQGQPAPNSHPQSSP